MPANSGAHGFAVEFAFDDVDFEAVAYSQAKALEFAVAIEGLSACRKWERFNDRFG